MLLMLPLFTDSTVGTLIVYTHASTHNSPHFFELESPSPTQSHLLITLLIIPLITTLDTFIKNTHGLIRTPNLHLHKIRLMITATRTNSRGLIHILPRRRSS